MVIDSRRQNAWHIPVMANEVVGYLVTSSTRVVLDCTVATGGHAERMLDHASGDAILIGIDLDGAAMEIARKRLSRFGDRVVLRKANFRDLMTAIPAKLVGKVDAVLIDCGISRLQIVTSSRGFSFDREGVLDMRFDTTTGRTAASVFSGISAADLSGMLAQFGERPKARRIANAIIRLRDRGELLTSADLAKAVKSVVKTRVAKSLARVFLAVRSYVNDELASLAEALEALPGILSPGGRACVITYHSGEARIVKTVFRKYSGKCICPPERLVCDCGKASFFRVLTPKPVSPSDEEIRVNPSARSARIRVVERCNTA
jgi:16S rRNA (cytosine1402-N4)-methyltransferase